MENKPGKRGTREEPFDRIGPYLFYKLTELPDPQFRDDGILLGFGHDDEGKPYIYMPQFDTDVCGDTTEEVINGIAPRLLSFYTGLKELPEDYVTDIQEIQRGLIEDLFLPYIAVELGRDTKYFVTPPTALPHSVVVSDLLSA